MFCINLNIECLFLRQANQLHALDCEAFAHRGYGNVQMPIHHFAAAELK